MKDIIVRDQRQENEELFSGELVKWALGHSALFLWLDTGYTIFIERKILEPIISQMVREEVEERLKDGS